MWELISVVYQYITQYNLSVLARIYISLLDNAAFQEVLKYLSWLRDQSSGLVYKYSVAECYLANCLVFSFAAGRLKSLDKARKEDQRGTHKIFQVAVGMLASCVRVLPTGLQIT